MTFLIISSMLLSFSLTAAFLYDYGKGLDDKARRIGQIKGKRREIDEELNIPLPQRFLRPVLSRFVKFFSRLLPKNGRENPGILKKIKMAGIKMPPDDFIAVRVMSMAGIAALSLLFAFLTPPRSPYRFFIVIYGLAVSAATPNLYLSFRIGRRQEQIKNQMPDIMDLLTVCVEAGLSFDMALLKIRERFSGPMVDELMAVANEIRMGVPRREALNNLIERNSNIDKLKVFTGAVIQADQMGLPIKNVLKVQSSQLRIARRQTAEEKAMKAPVTMMLPLILFVFPVIFIILLGPTVMKIIGAFGG